MNNKIGLFEVVLASFTGCAIFCKLAGFIDWRWRFVVGPYLVYNFMIFSLSFLVVLAKRSMKKNKEMEKELKDALNIKSPSQPMDYNCDGTIDIHSTSQHMNYVSDECTDDGK